MAQKWVKHEFAEVEWVRGLVILIPKHPKDMQPSLPVSQSKVPFGQAFARVIAGSLTSQEFHPPED
eukprot:5173939-Amphidinium_carterae.1